MNIEDLSYNEKILYVKFKKFTYQNDCKFLFCERCYNHKNQILNGEKIFDLCKFYNRLEASKECSFYKNNNNEKFHNNIVISNF